jgi:hypothetical protein
MCKNIHQQPGANSQTRAALIDKEPSVRPLNKEKNQMIEPLSESPMTTDVIALAVSLAGNIVKVIHASHTF